VKRIHYDLELIRETYLSKMNAKNLETYLRIIVNEIEITLNKFSNELSANSIQLYNTSDENSVIIEVLICFKDYLEEFTVNLDIQL